MFFKLWCKYKEPVLLFVTVVFIFAIMMLFPVPCPIKHLTGISCAGCGMTRAVLAALRLDLAGAFRYHPLWVLLLPVGILLVFFAFKKKRLVSNITLWITAAFFFGVWIYRIAIGDEVVAIDLESGIIYNIIQKLTELFA